MGLWSRPGEKNLAYVKVGKGIGAGLLLDGQIYHGSTGSAGEIGHITIDEMDRFVLAVTVVASKRSQAEMLLLIRRLNISGVVNEQS
jgi:predicted NBD/HSP70 family sugar kinase